MKKMFPQLNIFVDRNLCGARKDNYIPRCEKCLEEYMIDGSLPFQPCSICKKKEQIISPVELAYQQMNDAGIKVVENYSLRN
jgi:hypothetical protein